ncbi:MAG: hypothetical protein KJ732_05670 [Candidatus Margulisbacteria bacterium]|nr:hypothetical protein [Candidatus Margulisiibacteriota bacterium]
MDLLEKSSWLGEQWQTQVIAEYAHAQLSPNKTRFEASLRERYQAYREAIMADGDLRLPHYYFKSKGHVTGWFLDQVLKGRIPSDMHDVRGNFIIMRTVPAFATGMFPSQRSVAYEVALTRDIEGYVGKKGFHIDERYFGSPFSVIHFHESASMEIGKHEVQEEVRRARIQHTITAVIVSETDGGELGLARDKVAASGLDIPVISDYEAILEAELLYRAELKYDLPTLLREGRAELQSYPLQEVEQRKLSFSPFWTSFHKDLHPGEVVGVGTPYSNSPERFDLTTWGIIIEEGGQKTVRFLSDTYPLEIEDRTIRVPTDFSNISYSTGNNINVFNLRRTGRSVDLQRVAEIGLAEAIAEKEAGAELII